jgi:hypothetical protein
MRLEGSVDNELAALNQKCLAPPPAPRCPPLALRGLPGRGSRGRGSATCVMCWLWVPAAPWTGSWRS